MASNSLNLGAALATGGLKPTTNQPIPVVTPKPASSLSIPSSTLKTGILPTASALNTGLKAATPVNNIKAPTNTLTPAQTNNTSTSSYQSTTNGTNGNYAPIQNGLGQTSQAQQNYDMAVAQQQQAQPQTYQPNNGLYGQLITGLANNYSKPSEDYLAQQKAIQDTLARQEQLTNEYANKTADLQGSGIDLSLANGQQGILANKYNMGQQALASRYAGQSSQLAAANQQQSQQQSALNQAAGFAAPQQVGYNSQYLNPVNGQNMQSGSGMNDAVSNVVNMVKSGQMSYADAQQALQAYGQGGTNALLQGLGSNFNVAQSNTLAAQQGSIKPAYDYAKLALTNLQNSIGGLNASQSTNIPIINQITQGVSNTFGIGSQAVQSYRAAIAEARGAIQKVLAATSGGTPTDYVGQSNALLPDNATPNQVAAALSTLETLGEGKVGIYSNPGYSNSATNSQGGAVQTKVGTVYTNW